MIDKLVFATSILVASVAAIFSVIGLATIFSGAWLSVVIMAGVLEIGKLVTATWLHLRWKVIPRWIRYYLTLAVLILMIVTAIGIFGYLSKAHLEQEGVSDDARAVVERIDDRIAREQEKIVIIEGRISNVDGGIDITESVRQQEIIRDGAWDRVQGDIDYSQTQITDIRSRLQTDLKALDDIVESYTSQGTTGSRFNSVDNVAKGNQVREEQAPERDSLRQSANGLIAGFQATIDKYRTQTQKTIDDANAEINRLRTQNTTIQDSNLTKVDGFSNQIDSIYDEIAVLNDEAFEARAIVRDIELEVGPIKYVTQLIYGEEGAEQYFGQAVRYLILTLIAVFDPLAILLLIASAKYVIIIKDRDEVVAPLAPSNNIDVKQKAVEAYQKAQQQGFSDVDSFKQSLEEEDEPEMDLKLPRKKKRKWHQVFYDALKFKRVARNNIQKM